MGLTAGRFSADTYQVLRHYNWPGNVRELQNVIRRAMALTADDVIGVDDIPDNVVTAAGKYITDRSDELKQGSPSRAGFLSLKATHVAEFEQHYLYEIMKRLHGDVSAAAKEARVPRGTLYRLLKLHNIEPSRFRHDSNNTESN